MDGSDKTLCLQDSAGGSVNVFVQALARYQMLFACLKQESLSRSRDPALDLPRGFNLSSVQRRVPVRLCHECKGVDRTALINRQPDSCGVGTT